MENYYKQQLLNLGDLLFAKYHDSKIKVNEHFQLICGKTPPTNNPYYYQNGTNPWINSGILTNLYFLTKDTPPSKYINELAKQDNHLRWTKPNSILITRVQPEVNKIAWCQTNQFAFNDVIWNLASKENNPSQTAILFFSLRKWIKEEAKNYFHGSVLLELRQSTLQNLEMTWVSNPTIQQYFLTILNNNNYE